jgi:C4-dicarboxylate-specific signal transduction histidine kinase
LGASVLSTRVRGSRPPLGALLAVAIGALLALSRLPLQPALGDKSPFVMAAPSMIVAAFLGGLWPTLAVGLLALWIGEVAMMSHGGPPLGPGGLIVYGAFTAVFAAAGEMRQRGLRRAEADAARLADMQSRLVQVARLNAMGEMAGALAHELNQPLTAIASYAGAARWIMQQDSAAKPEVADLLQKVSEQAVRAREIISRIRGHVSGEALAPQPCSLSAMFREAVGMVAPAGAQRTVQIRYDFDPTLDQVLADKIQLQQVVVNLVRNALDAMGEEPRPRLRIGSRRADGGEVEAYVADSGPGVDPDLVESLFEPFVSGKADGMGIGLSVSRSIVESHGGRIWVDAEPGGGAVFHFTLPPTEAQEAAA